MAPKPVADSFSATKLIGGDLEAPQLVVESLLRQAHESADIVITAKGAAGAT
jgi:hypothetical protein